MSFGFNAPHAVSIARQPILDRRARVFAAGDSSGIVALSLVRVQCAIRRARDLGDFAAAA